MLDPDQCWDSVKKRDATQDGRFFFGVVTTGVFCRPSCPCRPPLRANVRFYESAAGAARDGLRPCKRCRPLETSRFRGICKHIEEHTEATPTLADLSRMAGLSPFHFQRRFKEVVGVTPRQYAGAARLKKLKRSLRTSRDVTDAVYDAGYGSSSRVYERAGTRLGMTPKQYRQGGRNVAITYATIDSPVGLTMIGATDRGLSFVQFGDSERELLDLLVKEYPNAAVEPMRQPYSPEFEKWVAALNGYLAGNQPHLDLPLDIRATAFQLRVWNYLQSIPYGEVQSYGEVAAGIGQPAASRAVARACASNRVAIVIPCHRVIRGTGELGGYRWGLPRKRALIDLERRQNRAGSVTF